MAVTMTERAAKHVAGFIQKRGKGLGLRVGVRTTGCSGMAYKLEYVDAESPEDQSFESHGVRIYVDPKSLAYIDGTELDFVREGLLDPRARPERLRALIPDRLPSGRTPLRFE